MNRIRQIFRLIHISIILVQHGLDEIVLATHLFRPVRFILYLLPWHWRRKPRAPRAVRLRMTLEELGPIFVKFGQILSLRPDLIPEDITDELTKLQDRVPPFPGEIARSLIEQAYGCPLDQVFESFDETPIASASIAQVHAARLPGGQEVVVKVLRPNIKQVIERDIGLLYSMADLTERYWRDGRRLRPKEVVAEYEKTILDELDLLRESASATQLRRNFQDSNDLYVPTVFWPQTRRNVMVMERISGIPIGDREALERHGVNFKVLAERGVTIFFTQVFQHNFFHADMHPGNVFVSVEKPEDPTYISIDFGIVGTLTPEDQRYIAENLMAFFNRDYRRVAELHIMSGWVSPDTRAEEFESAIRTVCEPIFDRPLKDISFGHLLVSLFQTARRFNMEVQPQLVLLEKTMLNIEGLGRQLYPDLNLWQTAKPFLEHWLQNQFGPRAAIRQLRAQAPRLGQAFPTLPSLLYEALQEGRNQAAIATQEIPKIRQEIRRANRRTILAVISGSLIISAALLLGLDGFSPTMLGGAPWIVWLLGGVGGYFLLEILSNDKE
uniref:Probable protein kinase UbiB n=1 Tax=Candidatus Kentrum sp. TUN TaxID=2126343 RepID=A0A451A8W5_9GAMM|nr:MAG: 2-octaprenylphenol hydroxylase [Candidatus Kentron sp. TUN]VFK56212.1 MAG: 2-octaprenylphenol hydroxylase [Candidatus Kentron sp. TUN]VFK62461.1 MAG: 2-octaprenylphenol hydroxylase [Candidatus Kentron sp. TUN]